MKPIKLILFVLAIVFYSFGQAQDPFQNINFTDSTSTFIIKLNDNTSLTGKILEKNEKELVFLDLTLGKVAIPIKNVKKITALSGNQYCILTTSDDKKFTGLMIKHTDEEITIETETLGTLTISNSKIKDIKIVDKQNVVGGKYFFPNPQSTRYFFGPSAIPLEKGEGYYQNAYILVNGVQYGVSDNLSIGGGIGIPIFFFITPKVGFNVAKNLYIGGGVLAATTISTDLSFGMAVGYGSITFGSKENNFTVNGGWGAIKQEVYNDLTNTSSTGWEAASKPMFSLSAMVRVAHRCSIITENWFFATNDYDSRTNKSYDKYHSVLTGGVRLMGEKNSFDFALALPIIGEGNTIGIPYLDYVYKF